MELILERIAKRKTYTIGRLYLKAYPSPPQGRDVQIPDAAASSNQTPPPPARPRTPDFKGILT